MKLSDIGERSIIQNINKHFMKGADLNDCALIDNGDEYILLSTDLASTRTNIPEGASPTSIGEFAAAINLSDIAAMAGIPFGMTVSLAVDPETEEEFLFNIMNGIQRKLHEFDSEILGGDTKEGTGLNITGTILGKQKKEKTILRSGIRKGQVLGVTGNLGRAAAGYVFYRSSYNIKKGLDMILKFTPRVNEALTIAEHGAKFMTDISDGLYSSLSQIRRDSGLGAKIVEDELPAHRDVPKASSVSGAERLDLVAGFGGDYELLFTIDNSDYSDFSEAMKAEGIPVSFIGDVWEGENIIFNGEDWRPVTSKGYEHFQKMPSLGRLK